MTVLDASDWGVATGARELFLRRARLHRQKKQMPKPQKQDAAKGTARNRHRQSPRTFQILCGSLSLHVCAGASLGAFASVTALGAASGATGATAGSGAGRGADERRPGRTTRRVCASATGATGTGAASAAGAAGAKGAAGASVGASLRGRLGDGPGWGNLGFEGSLSSYDFDRGYAPNRHRKSIPWGHVLGLSFNSQAATTEHLPDA